MNNIESNSSGKKLPKSTIRRRALPAELFNELFASMPLKNAFGLLTKMPNGLLAVNVQKMINGIKEEMKNNKLNEEDCGSKLKISEEGLIANKHTGKLVANTVRAILPIPPFYLKSIHKPIIAFYYEMEILNLTNWEYPIVIGFCDKQFPLEGQILGWVYSNSIGNGNKDGIWIYENYTAFVTDDVFKNGDLVGLGIIQHPKGKMECFATWNGQLLGKPKLPSKFAQLQLFPAVNLRNIGDSIRAHFKKEEWQFKNFNHILE